MATAVATSKHTREKLEAKHLKVDEKHLKRSQPFTTERNAFKALQLGNPNYFGTLEGSPFQAVQPIQGNTYYEELGCVGYHPQQRQLTGVVYIYQPSGYGTDICGPGTPEYVRFYTSTDDGATWQDQGITGFQAHNAPAGTDGAKRLEYAVSLPADLAGIPCTKNPLLKVRAILSWNDPPAPDEPDWTPVWGNVREAVILREPRRFFLVPELFDAVKAKMPPELEAILDPEAQIATVQKAVPLADLEKTYHGEVPQARLAHKSLIQFQQAKSLVTPGEANFSLGIKLDPSVVESLTPAEDGNTSYEELRCIGLDPNFPSTLVGIIQVKKSAGYSGGPCTDGSLQHVAFWADFDGNGSFETHLGTAAVRVYDVKETPDGGVHYAVRLPVNLEEYRKHCKEGPHVVRIRAILSWNTEPPSGDPDHVPTWGNREETSILIGPLATAPAGKIAILGGIPTQHIHDATGLTTPQAVFATNNLPPDNLGRPCPFGGHVAVQGAPLVGSTYKVEVRRIGESAWAPVVTPVTLTRWDGTTYVHHPDPATTRFDYVPFQQNVNGLLARWTSAGDDLWEVRLSTYTGSALVGVDTHRIQLDNTGPDASIEITSGAGDCGKFSEGTVLEGRFVARDKYHGSHALRVDPPINTPPVGVPQVVPPPMPATPATQNTPPSPGSGWRLETQGMKPCGYVIHVVVRDRAIINSQSVGHHRSASAGFCLEK